MQKYSLVADVETVSVAARAAANPNGEYYLASEVDTRMAELEGLLKEARIFMEDDFPPIPASQLTFEQCCATPRYFEFWKALHKALDGCP